MQNAPIVQKELDLQRLADAAKQPSRDWQVYLAAKIYVDAGLYLLPVTPGTKALAYDKRDKSKCVNYGSASRKLATIEKWFHPDNGKFKGYNIGVACGMEDGAFVVDVDTAKDGKPDGHDVLKELEEKHGKLPSGPIAETPNGGHHYLFQWQEHASQSTGKLGLSIDTRGGTAEQCKGHINVWPSVVDGKDYKWVQGGSLPAIPQWICDKLGILWQPKGSGRGNENVTDDDLERPISRDQIVSMLGHIDPDDMEYDDWLNIGLSIKSQLPDEAGLVVWDEWSKRGQRYREGECTSRWFGFSDHGTVRGGTLFYYAKNAGWVPDRDKGERSGNPIDEAIAEVNQTFAVTIVGGKIRVIRERNIRDHETLMHYDLINKDAFEALLADKWMQVGKKSRPLSNVWWAHQGRRTYENGLGLFPDGEVPDGYFNTWYGFSVESKQGDCPLFLKHIKEVICGGNEDNYRWLLDWCADLVQDPADPKGCAVVMRGGEGAGKGTLANTIGDLFGPHHRHLIDDSHLTSNFNAHLFDAITVFADEITWGGNKKTAGKLKGMVTEKILVGERKGIDAVPYRNRVHLLIASNSQWVIPAGSDSRRWFVLDVSDKHAKNQKYFNAIYKELNNGGREAFLHLMLNRDITSNLRSAPSTKALAEQRILNLQDDTVLNWWIQNLTRERLDVVDVATGVDTAWPSKVSKSDLHSDYEAWCNVKRNRSVGIAMFAKEMSKYGIKNERTTLAGKRTYVFTIPVLEKCKEIINGQFQGILGEDD